MNLLSSLLGELGIYQRNGKNRKMKIFLDDVRDAPDGWVRTFTPAQTISLLRSGGVTDLSLDHDLGDDKNIGTGYDVLLWIEEEVVLNPRFNLPRIIVHSMNPVAQQKMTAAIKSIRRRI